MQDSPNNKESSPPFVLLQKYYLDKHNIRIANQNENYKDYAQRSIKEQNRVLWRSEWHCPLKNNKIYHCSCEDSLEEFDGYFYFINKKASRRSAAVVALRAFGVLLDDEVDDAGGNQNVFGSSSANMNFTQDSPAEVEEDISYSSRHVPRWALPLHELGLKSSDVDISFEGKHFTDNSSEIHYVPLLSYETRISKYTRCV